MRTIIAAAIPLIGPDGRKYEIDDPSKLAEAEKLGYRVASDSPPKTFLEEALGVDADLVWFTLGLGAGGLLGAWGIYAFTRFVASRFVRPSTAAVIACAAACSIAVASAGALVSAVPCALLLLYRDIKKIPAVQA